MCQQATLTCFNFFPKNWQMAEMEATESNKVELDDRQVILRTSPENITSMPDAAIPPLFRRRSLSTIPREIEEQNKRLLVIIKSSIWIYLFISTFSV